MINIKKAELSDFDFFYKIRSEYSNIYWTGHSTFPKYDELRKWYEYTLFSNPLREILIIQYNNENVGYIYLDKVGKDTLEIAIAICEKYQGKGVGSIALKKLLRYIFQRFNNPNIVAWIFESNIKSVKLFSKNGFIATDETRMVDFPLKNTKEKQIKFIFRRDSNE
jgi:RimJ/RimL family protein N-acetyltransferase